VHPFAGDGRLPELNRFKLRVMQRDPPACRRTALDMQPHDRVAAAGISGRVGGSYVRLENRRFTRISSHDIMLKNPQK
jgi:hypothetical protein